MVRFAYDNAESETLKIVRAHDTRRLSTSWALFCGASANDILRAAHWASENVYFVLSEGCSRSPVHFCQDSNPGFIQEREAEIGNYITLITCFSSPTSILGCKFLCK